MSSGVVAEAVDATEKLSDLAVGSTHPEERRIRGGVSGPGGATAGSNPAHSNLPVKLCDVCTSPGACCKDFPLSASFWDDEDIHQQWEEMRNRASTIEANGYMPFEPLRKNTDHQQAGLKDPDSGRRYSVWRFMCPVLRPDGRCGNYDQRPGPCRLYEPAMDGMCVMYRSELESKK